MESASKSFPSGCWQRTKPLRVRPVPQMECCLVYTPSRPMLYTLNAPAWLAFELCDGRPRASSVAAYCQAVGQSMDDAQASAEFESIVEDLNVKGIVEFEPWHATDEQP